MTSVPNIRVVTPRTPQVLSIAANTSNIPIAIADISNAAPKTAGSAFAEGFKRSITAMKDAGKYITETVLPSITTWLGKDGGGKVVGELLGSAGGSLAGLAGRCAGPLLLIGGGALALYGCGQVIKGALQGLFGLNTGTNVTIVNSRSNQN
jgi:hypothetical protein